MPSSNGGTSPEVKPAARHPRLAIVWFSARRTYRGALLWGIVLGVVVLLTSVGYIASFPDVESREQFARTLTANPGTLALYGEPRSVETAGGYVWWRGATSFVLFGGLWGLFTATRLLRGEEDAGRWELLLAGQTTRRRSAASAIAGLGISLLILFAATALLSIVAGQSLEDGISIPRAIYVAFCASGYPALGLALGALTSQLLPSRRSALSWAAIVFGAMFIARAVATSAAAWHPLKWFTPMGWIEELYPLTGGRPVMIITVTGLIALFLVGTLFLAGRRDLGAGFLPERAAGPAHTRLLGGPFGLALRLNRGSLLAWSAGFGLLAFLWGLLIKTAAEAITEPGTGLEQFLGNLGVAQTREVENFLGFVFFFAIVAATFYAATQAGATREEEAQGFLDNLLARPVSRVRWLTQRIIVSVMGLIALGLIAGVLTWVAAYTQVSGVAFTKMLAAGLNLVPPALFVLGVGTLCHGLLPRLVTAVSYGVIAWSFLADLLGAVIGNQLLQDVSLFHYVALMPAADFRWGSAAVLSALGLAGIGLGAFFFNRRDLAGL